MLLKSYMSAMHHNLLELYPGVDLEKGEALSTSQLTILILKSFQPHRDRGLFNIFMGARTDVLSVVVILGLKPTTYTCVSPRCQVQPTGFITWTPPIESHRCFGAYPDPIFWWLDRRLGLLSITLNLAWKPSQ
jgi:hypothetical protein